MSEAQIYPTARRESSSSYAPVQRETDEAVSWASRYLADRLAFKRETTRSTYAIILRQFLIWLSHQPGHELAFDPPSAFTQTAV